MNKLSRILLYVAGLALIAMVIFVFCIDKDEPVVYNPVTAESGDVRVKDENAPKIVFEEAEYDFGTLGGYEYLITHTRGGELGE